MDFEEKGRKVQGLKSPVQLPESESIAKEWQALNRAWWEEAPMRYDWNKTIGAQFGTRDYFEEIDRRFFESVRHYMPWRDRPFDNLIDFESLRNKDVLEIGVGHGSHAQLIVPFCKSFTGIDLTQKGSEATASRLRIFGIPARIFRMDAEKLSFPDESFDFIWSWGVIHHSADPLQILRQMHRVLRPGGKVVVMVYHRSFWRYFIVDGFIKGILGGELFRHGSLLSVNQAGTDGAIARYYRPKEWKKLCEGLFSIERQYITGQKSDVIPLKIEKVLPDNVARIFTHQLRQGSFLVAKMRKHSNLL